MSRIFISLLLLVGVLQSEAAIVDTVIIASKPMKKSINCVVILPDSTRNAGSRSWPVVYLLHGYGGNYSNWIMKVPVLKKYADALQLIIVCPDGGYSSWYFDSPVDINSMYETYIGREVPDYIDAHYPTIKDRSGRAITGLSMGGHGGMFLGFRHADRFGACGSMSGGVKLDELKTRFDVSKRMGDTTRSNKNWKIYSVMDIVEHYPKDSLAIIIDCGTEDFFYADNRTLHEKMLKLKIKHDYIERPGKHDWNYWGNAVQYQLLFFSNYFNAGRK